MQSRSEPERSEPKSELSPGPFDRLLLALDSDREIAAKKYLELQKRLRTFFDYRGFTDADELVDETFDRAARRITETEVANVAGFVCGIARWVATERRRKPVSVPLEEWHVPVVPANPLSGDVDAERRLNCMRRCMAELPPERRDEIIRYYEQQEAGKIRGRRLLAAMRGSSLNALRVSTFRTRQKLFECARACMGVA
jgi:DNA-directed RNA polymerase specialized sigma24 family protein